MKANHIPQLSVEQLHEKRMELVNELQNMKFLGQTSMYRAFREECQAQAEKLRELIWKIDRALEERVQTNTYR